MASWRFLELSDGGGSTPADPTNPTPQDRTPHREDTMRHWLCKSEETCYSIADLERDGRAGWDSVRNY
ncbi:MAG: EVE domain-containing protein, partial [Planctomycetota bacterium]